MFRFKALLASAAAASTLVSFTMSWATYKTIVGLFYSPIRG